MLDIGLWNIGLWNIALWLVVLWLGGLLFQIADLGTAWFDLRNARTGTGQLTRRRAVCGCGSGRRATRVARSGHFPVRNRW